jgi:hypothetical protein
VLPDGTRLLGVHAAPGTDDGLGLHPALSEETLRSLLSGCDADLVCVGHTHAPMETLAGEIHVVNLGSISNPVSADRRASYVLLDADPSGYRLQHCRVAYDTDAVVAAMQRLRHPAAGYVARFMRGEVWPGWARLDTP